MKGLDTLLLFSKITKFEPTSLKIDSSHRDLSFTKAKPQNHQKKQIKRVVRTKVIMIDICLPKGTVMQTDKPLIACMFEMYPDNFIFQLSIILLRDPRNLLFQ